jgi:hypothetical protein
MSDLLEGAASPPPAGRDGLAAHLKSEGAPREPAGERPELVPILRHQVRRRRSEIQGAPGREAVAAGADEEVYVFPTSFDQERLFFVELLEPGSTYNVPMPVPFPGPVDVPALSRAVRELGQRHETLRTTFGYLDRLPVQVVSLESRVELEIRDLRAMPAPLRRAEAARFTRAHGRQPFDLVRGPLWRAALLRLADDDHLLLLNLHHVITDLWSTGLLVSELTALYLAFAQGSPSPLPALPLQYGDYAVWQRRYLDAETLPELMAYWKRQLAGAPQLLALPADRPRPAMQTVHGDDWMFPLGQELSQRLQALCRQQRVTLFHALLAGMAVLLAGYADVEDLLIGAPMSNRTRPGLDSLIGLFVNTVVLRLKPQARMSFNELLRQARATTLDAFDHQELPLGMLIDEILVDRSSSHTPLFQVMIAHQADATSARPYRFQLSEEEMGEGTRVSGATGTAKYDLVLSVMESDHGLLGTWEYNTDLFDEPTIQRLGRRYRQLLEAAVESPQRPLRELRRHVEALDRDDLAERPAASPPPPAPPLSAAPAPVAAPHLAPALEGPLDGLSGAEVDRLLAEVAAEVGEEAVLAALGTLALWTEDGPATEAERLLARLDQLSEAEVDGLLGRLLMERGEAA